MRLEIEKITTFLPIVNLLLPTTMIAGMIDVRNNKNTTATACSLIPRKKIAPLAKLKAKANFQYVNSIGGVQDLFNI